MIRTIPTGVISISATNTASASAALPDAGNALRVVNEGPNPAFIAVGQGNQVATLPSGSKQLSCIPVLANTEVNIVIPGDKVQNISAVCRSGGTAVLTVQVGKAI